MRIIAAVLLLELAVTGYAAQVPESITAVREAVLGEIQKFKKMEAPENFGGGDEHIGGWIIRHFHELQIQADIALTYSGDQGAIDRLIKYFDLNNPDDEDWRRKNESKNYGLYPSYEAELIGFLNALLPHRTDITAKARTRILRGIGRFDPNSSPNGPDAAFKLMDNEALESQMKNDTFDSDKRFYAARQLAFRGKKSGRDWLIKLCTSNAGLGGSPGAALLDSGKEGAEDYFRLCAEYEAQDKKLAAALYSAPTQVLDETFFTYFDKFMALKDEEAVKSVYDSIANRRLSAFVIARLSEQIRAAQYKDLKLISRVTTSLWRAGTTELSRQAAGLFIDEICLSSESEAWQAGARVFIDTGLGTGDAVAIGGRRHIKNLDAQELACRVLGEVGTRDDVQLVWDSTHPAKLDHADPKSNNWYDLPSRAWLPIIKLSLRLQGKMKTGE